MPQSPAPTPGRGSRRRPPRADYSRSRRVAAGISVGAAVVITGAMVAVDGLPGTTRGTQAAAADRRSATVGSDAAEGERGSATPSGDDDRGGEEGSSTVRRYRAVLGSDGLLHLVPDQTGFDRTSSGSSSGSLTVGGSGSGSVSPHTVSRGS